MYDQDTTLERPTTISSYIQATSGMFLTKRQSKFSPDAVYLVIIKKHDGYSPFIGFFHHRRRERGFLAYAEFTSEIRTVKLERSEPPFVSGIPYVTQCQHSQDSQSISPYSTL